MKISSAIVALVATLPSSSLAADECVLGSFAFEFDGACTPDAVVSAYEDQVFDATGSTTATCAESASGDLTSKLAAAGLTLDDLCDQVYSTQEQVPFTEAARRGDDLHFESMFYNGRTDWQEEVQTIYETEERTATSVLKQDAEAVRTFFDGVAQGRRVEWPGSLPNFQSAVTDDDGLATCTTNAAMCCWPKDRQANDNNGNCATPYDENCVDKDPADNTNLCFVDPERGNQSTGYSSDTGFFGFPGDNNNGEGAIHCHGLAWSNDVNHHTARYKSNNMFFVSMYDHMYQRGYVKNIPGAPMCGCVEQMPTVSRSDCTQVDLTETIEIAYHADTGTFSPKVASVHVDFNSCRGINNRNNDLWSYIARLYYEGQVTPAQFGEAGRIITNTGCAEATQFELNRQGMTPGYDHDVAAWTIAAGRESMKLHDGYGHRSFTKSMTPGSEPGTGEDPTTSHYGIIYRTCQPCIPTHKKIFYRRITPVPDDFNLMYNILSQENNGNGHNVWSEDFSLHSSYEDAVNDENPWQCPNNAYDYRYTFYGRCSPDGTRIDGQRSKWNYWFDKHDVAYFANKAEDDVFEVLPTTAIRGRDYAGGIALKDKESGAIYMTGSGRDIWSWADDFNYLSEPADGDHTVTVHAGSLSNPQFHDWSKSAIMFRQSMDPTSAHYSITLTGNGNVCPQSRLETGGHVNGFTCVNIGVAEAWLKVEKRMDTYTSYYSTQALADGPGTWTAIHSRTIPGIGASYNIGLGISSARSVAQEVIFTDYEVDRYYFPSAAPSVSDMPTVFVQSSDIGAVGVAGSASTPGDGSWTVKASGSDIWSSADQFHYVHFRESGDIKAELLVQSFDYIYGWQKGGVMFRETLDAGSKHYSLYITGSNGISNQWRGCTNCSSGNAHNGGLNTKPVWLQVTKVGTLFSTAYKYEQGADWMPLWSQSIAWTADDFYVGIAVTSHVNSQLATLRANQFNIEQIVPARNLRKMKGAE